MFKQPEEVIFADQKKTSELIGLSEAQLKKLRRGGQLAENVHWNRVGTKVLYCIPLMRDWIHNQADPEAHQRAVEIYYSKLPCNQKKAKRADSA